MNEGWTQWPSYGHAFGVRLHKLRRLRGLTQDGLAEIANLSRNQISNLERNENSATKSSDPTMSTIYRLARALHVPPAALMPAVGDYVTDICQDTGHELPIDIAWPTSSQDTQKFSIQYRYRYWDEQSPLFDDEDWDDDHADDPDFGIAVMPGASDNNDADTTKGGEDTEDTENTEDRGDVDKRDDDPLN